MQNLSYHKKLSKFGFTNMILPKEVKKIIHQNIFKILKEKLNLEKNLTKNKILNEIHKLPQKKFVSLFGSVSKRYLDKNAASKINKIITSRKFKKDLKFKDVSLHYLSLEDIKIEPKLDINQFCIFFRCVRYFKNDVANPHRDCDFWSILNKNNKPKLPFKKFKRFKIWIPIYGCNDKNSLRFYKYSHLMKIKVGYKKKDKALKPFIKKDFLENNKKNIFQPIQNFKNQCIIFDDKMVHFAPINKSSSIRISCEFTLLVKS